MNQTAPFNIIFAGTPHFAAVALEALIHSPHHVQAVYTQPDRPAGRGQKLSASPVKALALKHALPLYQPHTLKDPEEQKKLKNISADLMVVVAYGLILPKVILDAPRLGCLNIHASLLPRFRGAAPIQRAILAGEDKTGITIMQMDEGLDTGPMLYQVECPLSLKDTSETLHDRLAILGAEALLNTLKQWPHWEAKKQEASLATYAQKISKEEARIDWKESAVSIDRKIRAFRPWPIAFTSIENETLRVWKASILEKNDSKHAPGEIVAVSSEGIDVATGKNQLRLTHIQFPGKRALPVSEILHAHPSFLSVGKSFS